jgi:retron-type reverse transcriptase
MKRYGNLFKDLIDETKMKELDVKKARKGKTQRRSVIDFEDHLEENIHALSEELRNHTWRPGPYRVKTIHERGKERLIHWDPQFRNNVVQHAYMRTVGIHLVHSHIRDTFAGFRGRGTRKAVLTLRRFIMEYGENEPIYALKGDVRKCYPSIDHDVLKQRIRRKIKDPEALWLGDTIIDSHSPGLPIGNYLSQLFANFTIAPFDQYVKSLHFRHYVRYCDDFLVLSSDKEKLVELAKLIPEYFREHLDLEIKPNLQVFPIERPPGGIDFIGYTFMRGGVVRLRKRTERRFRKAVRNYLENPCDKTRSAFPGYKGTLSNLSDSTRLWTAVFDQTNTQLKGGQYDRNQQSSRRVPGPLLPGDGTAGRTPDRSGRDDRPLPRLRPQGIASGGGRGAGDRLQVFRRSGSLQGTAAYA